MFAPEGYSASKRSNLAAKRMSRDDLYINTQSSSRAFKSYHIPIRGKLPSPTGSLRSRSPEATIPVRTQTPDSMDGIVAAPIGMALGSPGIPPSAGGSSASQAYWRPQFATGLSGTPTSSAAAPWDEPPETTQVKKSGKWRLFGRRGTKKEKSTTATPDFVESPMVESRPKTSGGDKRAAEVSRSNTTAAKQAPPSIKPIMIRSQTEPMIETPTSTVPKEPKTPKTPKAPLLSRKASSKSIRDGIKKSDISAPIPLNRPPMERYSIMFGGILHPDRPAQPSRNSIFARRQATLKRLQLIQDAIIEEENARARGEVVPVAVSTLARSAATVSLEPSRRPVARSMKAEIVAPVNPVPAVPTLTAAPPAPPAPPSYQSHAVTTLSLKHLARGSSFSLEGQVMSQIPRKAPANAAPPEMSARDRSASRTRAAQRLDQARQVRERERSRGREPAQARDVSQTREQPPRSAQPAQVPVEAVASVAQPAPLNISKVPRPAVQEVVQQQQQQQAPTQSPAVAAARARAQSQSRTRIPQPIQTSQIQPQQATIFRPDQSALILDSPTAGSGAEAASSSMASMAAQPRVVPAEPVWQMASPPSTGIPSSAGSSSGASSSRMRSASSASSTYTHTTKPSIDEPDVNLKSAVEISIARQISISRQQQNMLQQPGRTRPWMRADVTPMGVGGVPSTIRKVPGRVVNNASGERLAQTKMATPMYMQAGQIVDLRKSERVVVEGS
ncbi:unnamed protein product [Parascedosporium putredinis]|uniref:Uncharacterized protein n=1 Tax=Parascedosporium putredinis TaxID=1442378 RepID=A0A9P1GU28_9PEZI|nr:unnamed protein product [Parascedosporium putredinis]CAI7987652.1 unnamed protein product [Parascedosporium putredinis]